MPSPNPNFRHGSNGHGPETEREGVACAPVDNPQVLPYFESPRNLHMQLPIQSVVCFGAGVGITLLIMHLCRNNR